MPSGDLNTLSVALSRRQPVLTTTLPAIGAEAQLEWQARAQAQFAELQRRLDAAVVIERVECSQSSCSAVFASSEGDPLQHVADLVDPLAGTFSWNGPMRMDQVRDEQSESVKVVLVLSQDTNTEPEEDLP